MLHIAIPAFNEELDLPILINSLVSGLKAKGVEFHIYVLDDGSDDATGQILDQLVATYPVTKLIHGYNRGLAETIRDLFEYVVQVAEEDDILVRVEGDNTNDVSDLLNLVAKLNEGYDVVCASRFASPEEMKGLSPFRKFLSNMAGLYMRLILPIPNLREYTCGFRAYRIAILKKALNFYKNDFIQMGKFGFTCTVEKLVKLHLIGARFAETPFTLHYDRKQSSSKMKINITTIGYFVMALCYYWPLGGWRVRYRRRLRTTQ